MLCDAICACGRGIEGGETLWCDGWMEGGGDICTSEEMFLGGWRVEGLGGGVEIAFQGSCLRGGRRCADVCGGR